MARNTGHVILFVGVSKKLIVVKRAVAPLMIKAAAAEVRELTVLEVPWMPVSEYSLLVHVSALVSGVCVSVVK